jgi:hypothetical protein
MTVHTTWSKVLDPLTILAFGDHSYTVMFGSAHKPPLLEVGWTRWRPNFIAFPPAQRRT